MPPQKLCVFVAGLLAAVNLSTRVKGADQIPWAPDLPTAQRLAQQRGQLILLHFWSPDCEPCLRLEHSVFSDPAVGRAMSAGYIPVKVNVKQNMSLANQYGVTSWPTED